MNLLIDSNVILDMVQHREPFFLESKEIYIVTRNIDDFRTSAVPAIEPGQFLSKFF